MQHKVVADAPPDASQPAVHPRHGALLLQLLLVLSTLAIALQSGLVSKLWRTAAGWGLGGWPPKAAPAVQGLDNFLGGLYRVLTLNQPLLPWILWLGSAAGLLLFRARVRLPHVTPGAEEGARRGPAGHILTGALLVAIMAGAVAARAANLLPDPRGAWPVSNFDEQVYFTAARLVAQGELPYRDYLLIHPPGMAYALAPGLLGQAPWGGPAAFGAARQWLFVFSLLSVPLIFLAGRRLGGTACGLVAAAVLALDGNAAGVAVLETLVNLWSLLALLFYLLIPDTGTRRGQALPVVLCGVCCGAALVSKVPALAIAGALPLHALLLRRPRVAAGIAAATGVATLVGVAPFLILAPGALVREVLLFPALRPQEVSPGVDHAARIAAYPESFLTTTLAAVGLLLLAAAIVRSTRRGQRRLEEMAEPAPAPIAAGLQRLLVVVLWATPVLAVFVLSRTYHATHYVQWVPPLALLAGAAVARPVRQALLPRRLARSGRLLATGSALAVLLLLPLAASAWQATVVVPRDTVYFPAGAAIARITQPQDAVLSFDPGYGFLAGRAPVWLPGGGRLVDSAAYMTYYALGLDRRPLRELLGAALHAGKEQNATTVFQSATAQASILPGFRLAPAVVVDGKIGLPQLRGQTLGLLGAMATSHEVVGHVTIYHLDANRPGGADLGSLRLQALTLEPLAADGRGTGVTLLPASGAPAQVPLAPGQVLQIGAYWQPRPGLPDARIRIRLVTEAGQAIVDLDQPPEAGATHLWDPNLLYPDLHNLQIPATPLQARYGLALGVSSPGQEVQFTSLPVTLVVGPGR